MSVCVGNQWSVDSRASARDAEFSIFFIVSPIKPLNKQWAVGEIKLHYGDRFFVLLFHKYQNIARLWYIPFISETWLRRVDAHVMSP